MQPFLQTPSVTLYNSDCLEGLKALPSRSVDCCVTTPPYYAFDSWKNNTPHAIGFECTHNYYIAELTQVFREIYRVLKNTGTLFIINDLRVTDQTTKTANALIAALKAEGFVPQKYESDVTTLLTKTDNYYHGTIERRQSVDHRKFVHPATIQLDLIHPCISYGCPPNGTVIDPFSGLGSTLLVAQELGRRSIGFEVVLDYCQLTKDRLDGAGANLLRHFKLRRLSKDNSAD